MALIDPSKTFRIDIPHEPGEWIEIKPLSVGDIAVLQRRMQTELTGGLTSVVPTEALLAVLRASIQAWSYPVPVSEESISRLDRQTSEWLQNEVDITSGRKDEEEKKESNGNSPSRSRRTGVASPVSSAT